MADYTFSAATVLFEGTGDLAVGATGVLRPLDGGAAVQLYDLNDSPLTSITVGPLGSHQAFKADIPHGLLDFGSLRMVAVSIQSLTAAIGLREDFEEFVANPPSGGGGGGTTPIDATDFGRQVIKLVDAGALRALISLDNVNNTSDAGKPISNATADALALRAPKTILEAVVNHDGSTGGGTRPSGYLRVRWLGGTTRPTNMVAGDLWEHDA